MKKQLLILLVAFLPSFAQAQLGPGDIVFSGYDVETGIHSPTGMQDNLYKKGFSFVNLVDIPAFTTINFTDRYWNGTSFSLLNNDDGLIQFTATSTIPAGTSIHVYDTSNNPSTLATATVTQIGSGTMNLQAGVECIYAYLDTSPFIFLGAFSNLSFGGAGGLLTGTNLSTGAPDYTAFEFYTGNPGFNFHANVAAYIDATTNFNGTLADLRAHFYDHDNWKGEENFSGSNLNLSINGVQPDIPDDIVSDLSVTVLPVELISFNATLSDDQVAIKWSTASELDSDYFVVERAAEDGQFRALEMVTAAGYSNTTTNYAIQDLNPLTGRSYYRLKQVDFDGTENYYTVASVDMNGPGNKLYPNPASDFIFLSNKSIVFAPYIIRDNAGVIVKEGITTEQQINIADLPFGIYMLELVSSNTTEQIRFVKSK